jgi:hypothetical protein
MVDFDASQNNDIEESKKQHILPDMPDVAPAKRSKVGIFFVFVLVLLIVGGIVYVGVLAMKNFQGDIQQEVADISESGSKISLTDLDEDGKVKQVVDPFRGGTPDASRIVQEKADFGDAPEETSVIGQVDYELFGTFPTILDDTVSGSVRHLETDASFYLGLRKYNDSVSLESDAEAVNFDEYDDGIILPLLKPCSKASIQVEVTVPSDLEPPYYLNALADWDRSGNWSGVSICNVGDEAFEVPEWFIENMDLSEFFNLAPGQSRRLIIPDFLTGPLGSDVWFRFTLTNEQIVIHDENKDWDGSGYFLRGETEDYLVPLFSDEKKDEVVEEEIEISTEEDALEDLLPEYKDLLSEIIFTDVPKDAWYTQYVSYVSRNKLINGYDDNTFRPEVPVTRSEVITVALRMRNSELQGEPADSDKDGLLDLEEQALQTDAKDFDTDDDGLND